MYHIRACTYTNKRAHTHPRTRTRARVRAHTHTHTRTHTYTDTHTRTHTHTYTHTHTHTHTPTHTHTYTHTCTCALARAHSLFLSPPTSLSTSHTLSHVPLYVTGKQNWATAEEVESAIEESMAEDDDELPWHEHQPVCPIAYGICQICPIAFGICQICPFAYALLHMEYLKSAY